MAAAAAPSLLAYNTAPSPTFLNQALALMVWALFVVACESVGRASRSIWSPMAALALIALGVAVSWGPGDLPSSFALSALGMLAAAALLLAHGAAGRGGTDGERLFALFCLAWVVAGVLNAGIALVQVFAPGLPDGDWIARSGSPGRAVGNLRQPNHLSSLLLWAAIGLVALFEQARLRRGSAWGLMALFVFAVVLSASRTGAVSVALLALWGLLDRRLSRSARALLLCTPLLFAAAWLAMVGWAQWGEHTFGGAARLQEADISSSRFAIWSNTLDLIRQHPWAGVGFGEFNLAWTLTPFPGRPTAFFDHSHNLPLQLLVELGLPLGGAVLALLLWALWIPLRRWRDAPIGERAALMMVLMIGLHSLLEYPLWYAYFLLPTAWAWGYALGRPTPEAAIAPDASPGRGLRVAGVVMVVAALASVADYQRVVAIFEAPADGSPLAARVADGRRSVLFSHHAAYAQVTSGLARPDDLHAFDGALHYLLDARLMTTWARALAAAGRSDEASFVAARLREFHHPQTDTFFALCADPASAATGVPVPGAAGAHALAPAAAAMSAPGRSQALIPECAARRGVP